MKPRYREYQKELHDASRLLLIHRRVGQIDELIEWLQNTGANVGKLNAMLRTFENEVDRLFIRIAEDNAVLEGCVIKMARTYRAAERKAEAKKKRATRCAVLSGKESFK